MIVGFKRLWREPLVHFLLIGAALFLIYATMNEEGNRAPNHIVITKGKVEQLSAGFKRTWMREPTEDEMMSLLENHIREEVFYREALAMGLDQNDPQVRMRMRMKLEYILEDLSSQEVSDEDLAAYLKQNSYKFHTPVQVSFKQVFFNPNKRTDLMGDVKSSLVALNNDKDMKPFGDPTLLEYEYTLKTQDEIARSFGSRFAEDMLNLKSGDWQGPIYSEYGAHLIKLIERIEGEEPKLEDVRMLVERDYLAQQRREQKELAYEQMRKDYKVSIEPLKTPQDEHGLIATAQASGVE